MRQEQFEKEAFIFKIDEVAETMYVVQSGQVDVQTYIETRETQNSRQKFIIEKLFRGSIINHNSVLMNDGIDTDAQCFNQVNVFTMDTETITRMRKDFRVLDTALEVQEKKLVGGNAREPALDYILKDPATRVYF